MYNNDNYIVELLQEASLIDATQLDDASHQKTSGQSTLDALVKTGKVTEEQVAQTLAINSGMDFVDLLKMPEIDPDALSTISADAAARFKVIPIINTGSELVVAVIDPMDFDALDSVRHVLPMEPQFVVGTKTAIEQLLMDHFGTELSADQMKNLGGDGVEMVSGGGDGERTDAPVIKMVYQILQEAYQAKASDIHIEPLENEMRVRYRIDGALHKVQEHPSDLLGNIVSRIKIMSGSMSVAEKRIPQDGRIQATFGQGELDLRVSTIPTTAGESVVMRILDKSSLSLGLDKLGFFTDDQATFDELIRLPDGIILVTGPTGSGKTTTLYSCLHAINKSDRKIITVEDPGRIPPYPVSTRSRSRRASG